jgi:chromate reductase
MVTVIGLSGSLRRGSFNTALLHAAAELSPANLDIRPHTIHGIPLYDADAEASDGIPPAVAGLKDAIAAADGLLMVTPEYNNSVPGVFKNAIDWLSRPDADIPRVFGGLPVGVIGASPGAFGTILSQSAWLPVLRTLGTNPWFGGRLMLTRAASAFDADGAIADDGQRKRLASYLEGFAAFVERSRR